MNFYTRLNRRLIGPSLPTRARSTERVFDMVRHWFQERLSGWRVSALVNGLGARERW